MAVPVRAVFANPEGTRARVEYDNGTLSEYPTNDASYPPWMEVLAMVSGGSLALEPYGSEPPLLFAGQYMAEEE